MTRKKLVAGNWKMHTTVEEGVKLYERVENAVQNHRDVEVLICPPVISLHAIREQMKKNNTSIMLGAQNMYQVDEGAFTGEISGAMLQGLVEYVLIGHSERRHVFHERDDMLARKMGAAIRHNIVPILCVGETLPERLANETHRVIHDQIASGLAMLTSRDVRNIVIAYEPVWAIGSGEIAAPDIVTEAFKTIRHNVEELYGKVTADAVRILYGGSVKPDYVADYLKIKSLDGFLVGGASLNDHAFADIVEIVHGK